MPTEEVAESEASEREPRDRREREEITEAVRKEKGAAGQWGARGELPLFLPTPSLMSSIREE